MPVVRAAVHNIVVEDPLGWHRLAKIGFGRDGSIYLMFPSLRGLSGVVASATAGATPGVVQTIDMLDVGHTTSHLVKFSYHPDGRVHFSQSGKVKTAVQGLADPLSQKLGHIFTARFQGIGEFGPQRSNDKSHTALFRALDGNVDAAGLACWRYDVAPLEGGAERFFTGEPNGIRYPDGRLQKGVFIAPPADDPYATFVLLLAVYFPGRFTEEFRAGMVFIGGFSSARMESGEGPSKSLLLAQYPCPDRITFAEGVRSIDLRAPELTGAATDEVL